MLEGPFAGSATSGVVVSKAVGVNIIGASSFAVSCAPFVSRFKSAICDAMLAGSEDVPFG